MSKKHSFTLAMITGATSGIGEQLAYFLADKGINLILTGRNQARLEKVVNAVNSQVKVEAFTADLATEDGRRVATEVIHRRTPNLMVNNAGYGLYGEVLTHDPLENTHLVNVDVVALMELSTEAARALISKGKKGVIVNVSSAAAFVIYPQFSAYAASKAFVNSFSESFDYEVSNKGVQVLVFCPGPVATQFHKRASKGERKERLSEVMSVEFAVEEMWRQILSGQKVRIINWKYRLLIPLSRLIPKKILCWIEVNILTNRYMKKEIRTLDSSD